MARLTSFLLVVCAVTLSAPAAVQAAWWPFSKNDDKQEAKVTAQTPIKPTPTVKKTKSWDWFGLAKPKEPVVNHTAGYGLTPAPAYARKQPEKKSWFGSWFQPEEPKKLKSIDDFMGAERPDF